MKSLSSLLFLLTLASCAVDIDEREVLIHHDAERDRLDVLFLQQGVSADAEAIADSVPFLRPKGIEAATELATRVLDGSRVAGIGWPLDFDLDQDDPEFEPGAEARSLLKGITVQEAKAFLDDGNRLSWYQHFRIERPGALLGWLNGTLNGWILDQDPTDESPWPRSRDLCIEAARGGWTWCRLEGSSLVLEIPAHEGDVAQVLLELAAGEAWGGPLLQGGLSSVRIADGKVTLVLGEKGADVCQLRFRGEGRYDSRLLQELRGLGRIIPESLDLDQLRRSYFRD